ncbi:hypothetical protein ACWDTP_04580 [Mycobacterium sp. NPDC003449]
MNTISSASDVITIEVIDEYIVIRRAMGGPDGQWTWRLDIATAQALCDHVNDLLDTYTG